MAFRPCSECRSPIEFGAPYWNCSVSTCNRAHATLAFCTVNCWDAHVATARHRDAFAVEQTAPRTGAAVAAPVPPPQTSNSAPTRRVIATPAAPAVSTPTTADNGDILIVVSKMKKYIRDTSDFSCSDAVAEKLSHHVRRLCDAAIAAARQADRKTVLDRDVPGTGA